MSDTDNPATEQDAGFDDSSAEPGVWRYVTATRATVIVDAEDYFVLMQQAMLKARQRIFMIGWDFDTRIHLAEGRRWWRKGSDRKYPSRLGSFILWLNRHRDDLEIRILRWGYGGLKFLTRGSMTLDMARWYRHKQIDLKFDTAHPTGGSHHQKIVVIDDHVAVCGGIDMTTHRWDTREHKEDDGRRRRPRGWRYDPWHDATMMVEGEAAGALGQLGRERWSRAGGEAFDPVDPVDVNQESVWPEKLEAQFENIEIGIARTRGEYDGQSGIEEIADSFAAQIASAKHHIYAETQYFASRRIANAICERLSEDDPPEIVIVHPASADGWLETQAMDHARAEIVRAMEAADDHNRFAIYVPYTGETPIYVHAKIMIVDDRLLRIGSANMNNRSMGLDSECDIFIDADRPANDGAEVAIARLRHSLLAEHTGLDEEEVPALLARYGSMQEMIARAGTDSGRTLHRYRPPELNKAQLAIAESGILDPEEPDDLFEAYSDGGLFPSDSLLGRARGKILGRKKQ